MDDPKAREIRQWMIKADHDLKSADRLLSGEDPLYDTAVYHCQQAAEKALKAFLTFMDSPFPKVHILSSLVAQCCQLDSSFQHLDDVAEILTPYATAFRYPGDVLEPDPVDAAEALQLARQVIKFVKEKIPLNNLG
jgi:HEPN domain-containing protein